MPAATTNTIAPVAKMKPISRAIPLISRSKPSVAPVGERAKRRDENLTSARAPKPRPFSRPQEAFVVATAKAGALELGPLRPAPFCWRVRQIYDESVVTSSWRPADSVKCLERDEFKSNRIGGFPKLVLF